MKSFFELHTELYYKEEGLLSADIDDVFLKYSRSEVNTVKLEHLRWKTLSLDINKT
ncbi:hypothetical protein [Psychroserpens mesophilus]|uniref:hypothetical protein n=1 Tax=Psychroserpens mesophilus TaxID=325473 RepID=UPI003D654B12